MVKLYKILVSSRILKLRVSKELRYRNSEELLELRECLTCLSVAALERP
jgi:hypothetical protein